MRVRSPLSSWRCMFCLLDNRVSKRNIFENWQKHITFENIPAKFEAKDHLQLKLFSAAKNPQARRRILDAYPFFGVVTDLSEQLFDQGFHDFQTPPGNSKLHPVGRSDANKGVQIFELHFAPKCNLDNGAGIIRQQNLIEKQPHEFLQTSVEPGNGSQAGRNHDEYRGLVTDAVLAELRDRLLNYQA